MEREQTKFKRPCVKIQLLFIYCIINDLAHIWGTSATAGCSARAIGRTVIPPQKPAR
jgi:hypothetical protein